MELQQYIKKPEVGAPCNGCGRCCQLELCKAGRAVFGDVPAPCPALEFADGRSWCGLMLVATGEMQFELAFALGIGVGCDSKIYGE